MLKFIPIFCIKMYQFCLSPLWAPRCRFSPSCSEYSLICFREFPFFKALWYSATRLLKCHPFHPGGEDRVPIQGGFAKDGS